MKRLVLGWRDTNGGGENGREDCAEGMIGTDLKGTYFDAQIVDKCTKLNPKMLWGKGERY